METVFHYGDWLALDRVGAAAGGNMERLMKAILRIFIMRQAHSLQRKQRRFLGWKEEEKQYQKIAEKQWRVVRKYFYPRPEDALEKTQTQVFCWL